MIIAVPLRAKVVVPQALQVGRNRRAARATELQVARIVEIEIFQFQASAARHQLVGCQPGRLEVKFQPTTLHQGGNIIYMCLLESVKTQLVDRLDSLLAGSHKIPPFKRGVDRQVIGEAC